MFELNSESLLIRGRQGDSASFTFNFSQNIEGYCAHFYIKRNIKEEPIIEKIYENPQGSSLTVNLLPEETRKLNVPDEGWGVYFWGLKLHSGDDYAQTVIPQGFKPAPMMYVYPEIGGCNE